VPAAVLDISRYLFVNAMTTVSAVVFLYSPKTVLASVAIVNLDEAGDIGPAAAMASLIVVTSALVCGIYFAIQRWLDRRTQPGGLHDQGQRSHPSHTRPLTTSLETKQAMLRDWGSWDASFNAITGHLQGLVTS
jgi:hypothetical protein